MNRDYPNEKNFAIAADKTYTSSSSKDLFLKKFLIVNFGGPRDLNEIPSFLTELLCDRDVIRTPFPSFFHKWLFSSIAKKRAEKVKKDYLEIGGKSPIYFDTEKLKHLLEKKLQTTVYTFHRYLPGTHEETLNALNKEKELVVFPMFPQFCYATTGSIARFLKKYLKTDLFWIKSYASHPAFLKAYQKKVHDFLQEKQLFSKDTLLLFSAHGVPLRFSKENDPYEKECESSFEGVRKAFENMQARLSYQSKFGPGKWITPYTEEACKTISKWSNQQKQAVVVPLSFTSDHIETLFEIEKLYLPLIEEQGIKAYRCPALNLEPYWIDAIIEILKTSSLYKTEKLIRQ